MNITLVVSIATVVFIYGVYKMSEALNRLVDEVTEIREVAASAVALIGSIAEQIRDCGVNEDALNALADDLDATSEALAAAVAANTLSGLAPEEPVITE